MPVLHAQLQVVFDKDAWGAGVIIHPTSLPGPFGIGEIGEEAFRLVDWMVSAGLTLWQVQLLQPIQLPHMLIAPHHGLLCSISTA